MLSFVILLISGLFSGTFMNSYLEMELPPQFNCMNQTGSKWVCLLKDNTNDFTVVTNAVLAGPYDNTAGFMDFFDKEFKGFTKKAEFMYIKTRDINGKSWVEAQHKNSERKYYITRYLVTSKDNGAFIVVFNIRESKTKKYAAKLYQMVQSLKLRDNFVPKNKAIEPTDGLLGYLKTSKVKAGKKRIAKFTKKVTKKLTKNENLLYYILAVVIIVSVIIIVIRRKKKKKNKRFF